MIIKMQTDVYRSIAQDSLGWKMIEPIIERIKGKDPIEKSQVYAKLTEGQKALFMFFVFHKHTESIDEFYWFASYFVGDLQAWQALKKGMRQFEDEGMLRLYDQVEALVESYKRKPDRSWREAIVADLEQNEELYGKVSHLYEAYKKQAPATLEHIHHYIQHNVEEFVELVT
ncbi:hypothetical protein [Paenibacillus alvei]|uniref:Uncharacterized protein n=1 Tax=Paenibacillus alvei TaxID=44250 RepID=A0A383R8W9_PAEAL|nr:hypothetical protein [Paenibacillus alvei]SYX83398.1 conserved protein of unknown function [Paenibacillus alvei]